MTDSQRVILRNGAIHELSACVNSHGGKRLLLVVDETAYHSSGASASMEHVLAPWKVARFSDFQANPKLEDLDRGVQLFRNVCPDLVVAIGGGSAIDMAKLIAGLSVQDATTIDLIRGTKEIVNNACAIIAIPTTSGTGSEATHFAVVYVHGEKFSVAHDSLLPKVAIIDPDLTAKLPPSITAATGLDALCQAIESMWSVGSNHESLGYARDALKLAWENLERTVHSPTPESRFAMSCASHLAGKAINIGKTTSSHALSYFITSRYGIPHGVAVALTISQMLAFNSLVTPEDCVDRRGTEFVRSRIREVVELLGCKSVSQACDQFRALVKRIGCPGSLRDAGIAGQHQILEIIKSVNQVRMANNPRRCTAENLMELLRPTVW